jgi:integrase/recombinase XerC
MQLEPFIDFLTYEKRYSKHTITAYQTDLKQFLLFIQQQYETDKLSEITHQVVRSWIVQLMEEDISTRSINRKISTLKSLFKFLKRQGEIEHNPMQKVISPKTSKRLPVFVEESKMQFLFDEIEFTNDFKGARDKLIIELFYATGMRLSELINIKHTDLNGNSVKVLGKRNKERIIPISDELRANIEAFISRKNSEANLASTPYLLVTDKGEKLYEKFVYRAVNHYLGLVTSVSKKSPHILRHTFATHMLNNGADLGAIKEILGHANLSATQVYTHNTIEKLKSIHNEAHPHK